MTTAERPELSNRPGGTVGTVQAKAWTTAEVPYSLSGQELDVLYFLREGLNESQIAAKLHVTEEDVRGHVGFILAKTNSRSKTEAAVKAIREGIFPIPRTAAI